MIADIVFQKADVCWGNNFQIVRNVSLAVKDGKILGLNLKNIGAKKTYHLKNKLIIPGFVNSHTHAAMVAFRGMADDLPLDIWLKKYIWPKEKKELSPAFVKKWVKLASEEMLAAGITTFSDMYFYEKEAALVASKAGIKMIPGEAILDFLPNVFQNVIIPGGDFAITPHAVYSVSAKNIIKAKKIADQYKKRLIIHTAEKKSDKGDIRKLAKLGILDENTVLVHAVWVSKKDIEIIAKKKAKVVYCPQSNMKLASGIAPVYEMLEKNIIVGLGTDGAASNNTLDMFREMKAGALLQKVAALNSEVLPAKEVFKMATINGARVFGKEKEIGSLKEGKSADLAIIDFNKSHLKPVYDYFSHLVYAVNASDIAATFVSGKKVFGVEGLKKVLISGRIN